jgi:hypothetical protein
MSHHAVRRTAGAAASLAGRFAGAGTRALEGTLGGAERTRVVVLLASVLALSSADATTVGASATELRSALDIGNTEIGLLVSVTYLTAPWRACPSAYWRIASTVRGRWAPQSSSGAEQ